MQLHYCYVSIYEVDTGLGFRKTGVGYTSLEIPITYPFLFNIVHRKHAMAEVLISSSSLSVFFGKSIMENMLTEQHNTVACVAFTNLNESLSHFV